VSFYVFNILLLSEEFLLLLGEDRRHCRLLLVSAPILRRGLPFRIHHCFYPLFKQKL